MNAARVPTCWVCFLLSAPGAVHANSQPVSIRQIGEVIEKWHPDQHLYVKGDLGIGATQLSGLEAWLNEKAPHWTVVLLRNARNEFFEATDGRHFRGMDAVEYALGHGLANRTGFGSLENGQTGETDGAVFVLFYDERKFSYYASDAQDRRALGEAHWVGNLDRPAFRAMRNGERILDAVQDTISNIDGQLQQRLDSEVAERERAQRERERSLAEARRAIQAARVDLEKLSSAAHALQQELPEAQGELVEPPVVEWQSQLDVLSSELTTAKSRTTSREVQRISSEMAGYANAYAHHQVFNDSQGALEARLESMGSGPNDVAWEAQERAAELVSQARQAHNEGRRDAARLMDEASATLDEGQLAIAGQQRRQARAAARRRLIRRTALATALVLLAAFCVFLWVLNRRRMPARKRARQALAEREQTVRKEMDRVLELFSRAGEILGTKETVVKRGYVGDTKQQSEQTFESVDDLLVMSNEVERVMDEARELIQPSTLVGKLVNAFSGTRFERGVNRISGEPLQFHRDRGVPLVLEADQAMGNGDPPTEISRTFEQVFNAFHRRGDAAAAALDILESSLVDVNDQLQQLQTQIDATAAVERALADAAQDDGYFAVTAFFEKLLPSVEADYDQADELSASDPVQAAKKCIPSGLRKTSEAGQLAEQIQRARRELFPALRVAAPKLEELGYETRWMDEGVRNLVDRANRLFDLCAQQSVASEIHKLGQEITQHGETASQCVELATQLQDQVAPSLEAFKGQVQEARNQVSETLGIAYEQALHEPGRNPDAYLEAAAGQLDAARAALHHGNISAATDARQVAREEVEEGQALVTDTRDVLRTFDQEHGQQRAELEQVGQKLSPRETLLGEIREAYAASALILQAADPTFPDPAATLDSHLTEATAYLERATQSLNQAHNVYSSGGLLQATELLDQAAVLTSEADQRLHDIDDHCRRIRRKDHENEATLSKIALHAQQTQSRLKDPRVTRATLAEYEGVSRQVELRQRTFGHRPTDRDPFEEAGQLASLMHELEHVDDLIVADHDAHAEATRASQGAQSELAAARRLVDQAARDGIPDSSTTAACVRQIASLASEVRNLNGRLSIPHDEWQQVNEQATRLTGVIGVAAGQLRGDLQQARQSVDVLQQAAQQVFQATRWTGDYGVRVGGSPGADQLQEARRLLNAGDYVTMLQMARAASLSAQHAIQRAQREIARRRREAERQAEEARRRRQRSSAQIGSSSTSRPSQSFGGASHGRGSSSGFGRSGW